MNRAEFLDKMFISQLGSGNKVFERAELEEAFDLFSMVMQNVLLEGDVVYFREFMKISVKRTKPKVGRNPQTGDSIDIPAKNILKVTLMDKFDQRLNSLPEYPLAGI